MREIKFRVYQPNLISLGSCYLKEEEAVENLINPFNGKLVFNIDDIEYNGDEIKYYNDSGYILEQYINRIDKCGKEIFENDIIEVTDGDGWIVGYHLVKYDEETLSIHDDCIGKIAGNIHENIELLEQA